MNKEFSEGFMRDIADLLDVCKDNGTDGLAIEMDVNGRTLIIDIQFKLKEEEWK